MKAHSEPQFEMRHRMNLALEYGSVTVNEMASHLEISRTTISNYLHGRTQPQRAHLIAWAFKCGVPFPWLVGVEGEPAPTPTLAKATAKKATKATATKTVAKSAKARKQP